MHAVGAAGHGRVHELEGARLEHRHQRPRGVEQQVGGARQRGAQGGVDHVGGGEPVVDPRPLGRADGVLDHVDEGGHVVVGDALAVVDGRHQLGRHLGGPGPHGGGGRRGGSTPTSAQPSTARSSTSSHISKRASSVNSAAISGSE